MKLKINIYIFYIKYKHLSVRCSLGVIVSVASVNPKAEHISMLLLRKISFICVAMTAMMS